MPKPLPVALLPLGEKPLPPPLRPCRWRSSIATGLCIAGLLSGAWAMHREAQIACTAPLSR